MRKEAQQFRALGPRNTSHARDNSSLSCSEPRRTAGFWLTVRGRPAQCLVCSRRQQDAQPISTGWRLLDPATAQVSWVKLTIFHLLIFIACALQAADEEAMDAACAAIIGFLHRVSGTTDEGPADEANGMAEEPAEEEEEAEVEEEEEAAEEANGAQGEAGASKKRASRSVKPKPAKQSAAKETKKSARSRGVTKPGTPGKTAAPAKKKAASKPAGKAATPAKRKAAAKPAAASKGKAASKPAAKAATPSKRKAAAKPVEAKATPTAAAGKRKRSSQPAKEKAPPKAGKAKPPAATASKTKGSAPSKSPGATKKRAKRS